MFIKIERFLIHFSIPIAIIILLAGPASDLDSFRHAAAFASYRPDRHTASFFAAPPLSPSPQPVWQRLNYPNLPSGRLNASLTYNPVNQNALLFGGFNSTSGLLNELWLTNGRDWMQFYTPHSPPERSGANLVYDEAHQGAVLFGGANDSTLFGDTWFFNGIDWIQKNPPISPSPRVGASMAYDAERKISVLFGGLFYTTGTNDVTLGDMWVWDGENWQQQFPAVLPPARWGASMVYDAAHLNILLFGGAADGGLRDDTWIWDGSSWIEQHPMHHPAGRADYGMAYDESRQQVILFGGQTSPAPNPAETWVWDGEDWIQLQLHNGLPEDLVFGAQLVYLPELQTVMLFGDYRWKTDDPEAEVHFGEYTEVWALNYQYFIYLPTTYHPVDFP